KIKNLIVNLNRVTTFRYSNPKTSIRPKKKEVAFSLGRSFHWFFYRGVLVYVTKTTRPSSTNEHSSSKEELYYSIRFFSKNLELIKSFFSEVVELGSEIDSVNLIVSDGSYWDAP